jgi:hypothetical protein
MESRTMYSQGVPVIRIHTGMIWINASGSILIRYPYLGFDAKNLEENLLEFIFFPFLWVNFAFPLRIRNPDPQAKMNSDIKKNPDTDTKLQHASSFKVSPASVCLSKKMWGVDFHVHGTWIQ